jgi:hypothetical protein
MLVGHSQGGMVAVRAANDFVTAGKFNVTPYRDRRLTGRRDAGPKSVQVLSMENAHDIVPPTSTAGRTPSSVTRGNTGPLEIEELSNLVDVFSTRN